MTFVVMAVAVVGGLLSTVVDFFKKKMSRYIILGVNAFLVSMFWLFFYFNSYILFFLFLVPKSINACYFCSFRQSTNENS